MVKKKSNSTIGLGILDELKEDLTSETIVENKPEKKKEVRSKRSFMLNETAIKQLQFIKLVNPDKDLSGIVEEAINLYFINNKSEIDNILKDYNSL